MFLSPFPRFWIEVINLLCMNLGYCITIINVEITSFALPSSTRWLVLNMWCPTLFWWAEGSSILWIISIWIGTQLPVLYLLSRCNKMKIFLRNKQKGEKRASSPRQHYWDYMGGHIFSAALHNGWNSIWSCFPSHTTYSWNY